MYRDPKCQHHLVQDQSNQKPDMLGLTPVDFERWMTLLIQAHPEEGYKRLRKAVLDMPIRQKRKGSQRRTLGDCSPKHGDRGIREHVEYAIAKHADIPIPLGLEPNRTPKVIHPRSANRCATYRGMIVDASASFYPQTFTFNTPQHFEEPTYKGAEKAKMSMS